MIKGIDKVYVLHVKEGYEDRAVHMEELLGGHDMPFEYILDYDIPDLLEEEVANYYDPAHGLDGPNVSVGMKHIDVLKKIVENGFSYTLVFEDDVFFDKRFDEVLTHCMEELKTYEGGVAVSLGNAANHYTPREKLREGKYLYPNVKHRAADSYLLNLEAAKRRLAWFETNKTIKPAGHMYNQIDVEVGNTILWLEPTVVEQGSQNGLFLSSIQEKKRFHRFRWLWRNMIKKYISR